MQNIKLLAVALLATVSLSGSVAHAQSDVPQSPGPGWALVVSSSEWTTWAHLPSRVRNGAIVSMWLVTNYSNPRQLIYGPERSNRSLSEYDCRNRNFRPIQHTAHSQIHARDNPGIYFYMTQPQYSWSPIPPNSLLEQLMNIACGR